MNDRARKAVGDLREAANEADMRFGGMSEAQLNWKPAKDSWSVAQCLDHIVRTNTAFFPDLDAVADGTRRNSIWERFSPLTGYFGRFLISSMMNDDKKVKSPSKTIVPPSDIEPGVPVRCKDNISEMCTKIEEAAAAARNSRIIFTSPFAGVITYSFWDACTLAAEHTKRHVRQATRVAESENFPAAVAEKR